MSDSHTVLYHQQLGDDNKPCFVILHGLFGSSPNFTSLAKALSANYRVIRFDLPNHGRSYHTAVHNYEVMATLVLDSLTALGVESFSLLGHSMGGKTAIEIAAIAQERIDQLVIVDIAPVQYSLSAHSDVLAALNAVEPATLNDRQDADATIARWIDDPNLRQFLMTNLQRSGGQFSWRINLPVLTEQYANIAAAPNIPDFFDKPCLFVRGGNSDYILPAYEPMIREHFPQVKIETVANAGHWLHAEAPQPFWNVLSQFLES